MSPDGFHYVGIGHHTASLHLETGGAFEQRLLFGQED